jgi:hypothetical protein
MLPFRRLAGSCLGLESGLELLSVVSAAGSAKMGTDQILDGEAFVHVLRTRLELWKI